MDELKKKNAMGSTFENSFSQQILFIFLKMQS